MNIKTQVGYTLELLKARYPTSYDVRIKLEGEKITVNKVCTVSDIVYTVKAHWELFHWWLAERRKIQNVFPNLTDNQREFLISGTTPAEWDAFMPSEEEE